MTAATLGGAPPWRIWWDNIPENDHVPPCLGKALRRVIIMISLII